MFCEGDPVEYTGDFNSRMKGKKGHVVTTYDDDRDNVDVKFEDGTTRGVLLRSVTLLTNTPRLHEGVRPRGSDLFPTTPQGVREFGTGATRDLDANKLDFEGFLSPLVLERYAEHMHKARRMPDGSMRESDNWQLGIPIVVYMKSLWRHFFAVWKLHRGLKVTEVVKGETIVKDLETELCALMFNTSGMLHEHLKAKLPTDRPDGFGEL